MRFHARGGSYNKVSMRAWNRAKLLWGYLAGRAELAGLPVEYIVETTAKCNLYCPMCPRETHKQPKADMSDEVFRAAGPGIGRDRRAHDADRTRRAVHGSADFRADRVLPPAQHFLAALDQWYVPGREVRRPLLDSPLEQITLSFDGAKKETFEFYRKGAKFEKVRDNFVRFARMKKRARSRLQVVVQMVQMEGNAGEVGDFLRSGARFRGSTRCASRPMRPT